MSFLFLIPLAFVGGMAVPTQFAVNSQLRNVVGSPVSASATSFIVGAVALSAAAVLVSRTLPQMSEAMSALSALSALSAPWWVWTGGLLGAFYVLSSVILTPLLGAAATVGFFLAGQLFASVAIDHFGLLGVPASEVSAPASSASSSCSPGCSSFKDIECEFFVGFLHPSFRREWSRSGRKESDDILRRIYRRLERKHSRAPHRRRSTFSWANFIPAIRARKDRRSSVSSNGSENTARLASDT